MGKKVLQRERWHVSWAVGLSRRSLGKPRRKSLAAELRTRVDASRWTFTKGAGRNLRNGSPKP